MACTNTKLHVNLHLHMHMHMHMYMHTHMHKYMHMHIHIHVHIHTHTHTYSSGSETMLEELKTAREELSREVKKRAELQISVSACVFMYACSNTCICTCLIQMYPYV